jgi:hypothetical protein
LLFCRVDFQNWRDENEAGDQQEDLEEVTIVTVILGTNKSLEKGNIQPVFLETK